MRFKLVAAAFAAGSLAVGGVTVASADSGGSSPDHGGQTIRLSTTTEKSATLDLDGNKAFSLGDQQVFWDEVFARDGGERMGLDGGVCTIVRVTDADKGAGTAQCVVTLSLPDGQITTQGLVDVNGDELPPPFDIAIAGGTGAYKDARGQVTVEELSNTKANVTVHLSGHPSNG
jgi:hypothetical protein